MELRPHHGMCIGQFMGKGYNEEFIAKMKSIITQLESEQDSKITLVCHCDVICESCPNNEKGTCNSLQKVFDYDMACLEICGLNENQEISWREFKDKVKKQIIEKDKIKEICIDCTWIEICTTNAGKNY